MSIEGGQNVVNAGFMVSVRGKQFLLDDDAELVVGIGDHQFMLSLDYDARTVYLTDPRTGEKLNLQIKDAILEDTSVSGKLAVVDKIKEIIDVSAVGLTVIDSKTRVTSVEEYLLNENNLRDSNPLEISGILVGSTIYRIDLIIDSPFVTDPDDQHSITIRGENGELLVPETWSDPNVSGCYSTSLNYTIGSQGLLRIYHDLQEMESGSASLKLYLARPKAVGG